MWRLLPGFFLLLITGSVIAGEIRSVEAVEEQGIYTLEFDALIEGKFAAVRAIVTNHNQLARLSDAIVESEVLAIQPDGKVRRRVLMDTCILIFCFRATIVEDVEHTGQTLMTTIIIAAMSDFAFGRSYWHLRPESDSSCRLTYQGIVEPDFWIPPLIGPWLIKNKMREVGRELIMNIEKLAGNV